MKHEPPQIKVGPLYQLPLHWADAGPIVCTSEPLPMRTGAMLKLLEKIHGLPSKPG